MEKHLKDRHIEIFVVKKKKTHGIFLIGLKIKLL